MSSLVLNLHQNSQVSVKYGQNFDSDIYKLLEFDEQLLQELLENGLTVKGHPEEEAVLCTASATYAVKFVCTSNTLLLVPPQSAVDASSDHDKQSNLNGDSSINAKTEATAVATVTGHLELVEILPRVENLKWLLSHRPYKEDTDTEDIDEGHGLYTWNDLLNMVQASDCELRRALATVQAVKIGQYWRVVDSDLTHSVLQILLLTATQHDWPLNALPGAEVVRALEADNYSPLLAIHCLQCFGSRVDSQALQTVCPNFETTSLENLRDVKIDLEAKWALDETKVCVQFAKRLLASQEKWRLDEFLQSWRKAIPAEMEPNLQMLSGEALLDVVGPETWLSHFSATALPIKPEERFAALFQRRAKWKWDDLEPYLRGLKEPNRSVEALLLKYTRKTQPSSKLPPIYTVR